MEPDICSTFVSESGSPLVNEFSARWNLTFATHLLAKADHNLSTNFQTQLLMAWHNMAWLTEWLTFVPASRTLSPEGDSTTDSTTQSIDKPILRVLRKFGVSVTFGGPFNQRLSQPLNQPLNQPPTQLFNQLRNRSCASSENWVSA